MLALLWYLDGEGSLLPPLLLAAAFHEGAHLGALGALGIPVHSLELRAPGALIRAELRGRPREAWALAAGPAVNLLLALCFRWAWPWFSLCNLGLGLGNLLPLAPLDGGQLCALLLPRLLGRAGEGLCALLHWGTLAAAAIAGVWGTCVLHYGLLPVLLAGIFLLRLPIGLAKSAKDW